MSRLSVLAMFTVLSASSVFAGGKQLPQPNVLAANTLSIAVQQINTSRPDPAVQQLVAVSQGAGTTNVQLYRSPEMSGSSFGFRNLDLHNSTVEVDSIDSYKLEECEFSPYGGYRTSSHQLNAARKPSAAPSGGGGYVEPTFYRMFGLSAGIPVAELNLSQWMVVGTPYSSFYQNCFAPMRKIGVGEQVTVEMVGDLPDASIPQYSLNLTATISLNQQTGAVPGWFTVSCNPSGTRCRNKHVALPYDIKGKPLAITASWWIDWVEGELYVTISPDFSQPSLYFAMPCLLASECKANRLWELPAGVEAEGYGTIAIPFDVLGLDNGLFSIGQGDSGSGTLTLLVAGQN